MESFGEKKMISFSFTIPKKDLLAHVQQTPGAPAPESPEYLIVDKNGQNCTGTFRLGGGAGGSNSQQMGSGGAGVKQEPGTVWSATAQQAVVNPVKDEPMDHNDSGYAEGTPAIKAEPNFDGPATSTPVKPAGEAVTLDPMSQKYKCMTCAKLFATKAGANKHAATQHKNA